MLFDKAFKDNLKKVVVNIKEIIVGVKVNVVFMVVEKVIVVIKEKDVNNIVVTVVIDKVLNVYLDDEVEDVDKIDDIVNIIKDPNNDKDIMNDVKMNLSIDLVVDKKENIVD